MWRRVHVTKIILVLFVFLWTGCGLAGYDILDGMPCDQEPLNVIGDPGSEVFYEAQSNALYIADEEGIEEVSASVALRASKVSDGVIGFLWTPGSGIVARSFCYNDFCGSEYGIIEHVSFSFLL